MVERSFEIVGNEVVYTCRKPAARALHALRERSKALGGDGSDEAALALMDDDGEMAWQHDLDNMNAWDQARIAGMLVGDAFENRWPTAANAFIAVTIEEVWETARTVAEWAHEEFGRSEAAEQHLMDAVEAALREDGAETFRLVSAAMAEWRSLS